MLVKSSDLFTYIPPGEARASLSCMTTICTGVEAAALAVGRLAHIRPRARIRANKQRLTKLGLRPERLVAAELLAAD